MIKFQEIVNVDSRFRLSVIQWEDTGKFEIACQYYDGFNWEIDYSVFDDVIPAHSIMEVYGMINQIIETYNEHFEKYGVVYNKL